jgi:isovaleryl-CoA dehydrogenase
MLRCFLSRRLFGHQHINFHQIARFNGDLADLHKSVRKFVDEKVTPVADKCEKDNNFPSHLWREFGEMGLLGVTTPSKYGGSELNYTAHSMIME